MVYTVWGRGLIGKCMTVVVKDRKNRLTCSNWELLALSASRWQPVPQRLDRMYSQHLYTTWRYDTKASGRVSCNSESLCTRAYKQVLSAAALDVATDPESGGLLIPDQNINPSHPPSTLQLKRILWNGEYLKKNYPVVIWIILFCHQATT